MAGAGAGMWDRPQAGEAAGSVGLWLLMDRDLEAWGSRREQGPACSQGPVRRRRQEVRERMAEKVFLGRWKLTSFGDKHVYAYLGSFLPRVEKGDSISTEQEPCMSSSRVNQA